MKLYKTIHEFLIGDIFVYVWDSKRHHFLVTKIVTHGLEHVDMSAKFIWSGDNTYFDLKLGFIESFTFGPSGIDFKYEIKKTSPHGCCKKCFGELYWVTMALKCTECGTIF